MSAKLLFLRIYELKLHNLIADLIYDGSDQRFGFHDPGEIGGGGNGGYDFSRGGGGGGGQLFFAGSPLSPASSDSNEDDLFVFPSMNMAASARVDTVASPLGSKFRNANERAIERQRVQKQIVVFIVSSLLAVEFIRPRRSNSWHP